MLASSQSLQNHPLCLSLKHELFTPRYPPSSDLSMYSPAQTTPISLRVPSHSFNSSLASTQPNSHPWPFSIQTTLNDLKKTILFPIIITWYCFQPCKLIIGSWQDGSLCKGTCHHAWGIDFNPRTHIKEGGNCLSQVVLCRYAVAYVYTLMHSK